MASNQFVLNTKLSPTDVELHELIQNLLIVLSDKEKLIIQKRFAINEEEKQTLEEIGTHFGVTRERVRQIEKSALRKLERNAQNTNIRTLTEFAKELLKKNGGILSDKQFKTQLLKLLPKLKQDDTHELHLALELDPTICFSGNTLQFEPHWKMASLDAELHKTVVNLAILKLKKNEGELLKFSTFEEIASQKVGHALELQTLKNILEISKALKVTEQGVGLTSWRHINPKTLKDKIQFTLKQGKKALHFTEIAKRIRANNFDSKVINTQAVHNELIRTDQFILIGRGIYALADWGFTSGTVSTVIEEILSDGIARSREEITQKVLEKRQVKPITIYLNLKNKPQFVRVGRDKYILDKKAA